jgi:Family of unknown function (DUF6095)
MATNRVILTKGIIKLAWALPLLFSGPTIIYNAFINKDNFWHYAVLAVGIGVCGLAMYFMFVGLNTIMKSMFND